MEQFVLKESKPAVPIVAPEHEGQRPEEWLHEHREWLEKLLLQYGAVLLRGFSIYAVSEFNRFATAYSPDLLDYTNRSSPRTKLGGKIYTSTEYPKELVIPQHNENAYTHKWPSKLLFFCVVVAAMGGETPLADSRKIVTGIDPEIVKRFEQNGVMYVRNYHPGLDLSWQEVFQTESREEVERYCKENGIQLEWLKNGEQLRTKETRQATLVHPVTQEKVWFNQANLFHVSATGKVGEELIQELGIENVPRNACFGDGSLIPMEMLNHVNAVIESEKIIFPWQKSDLLIVENLLMSHGRNAYTGERKTVVAMV